MNNFCLNADGGPPMRMAVVTLLASTHVVQISGPRHQHDLIGQCLADEVDETKPLQGVGSRKDRLGLQARHGGVTRLTWSPARRR
jgi:hypothetical protein